MTDTGSSLRAQRPTSSQIVKVGMPSRMLYELLRRHIPRTHGKKEVASYFMCKSIDW